MCVIIGTCAFIITLGGIPSGSKQPHSQSTRKGARPSQQLMPKVNNQDSSVRAVRESRTNDFIHIQALHIKTQCRKKKKNNCFASGDKLVSSLAYDTDDNRAVKRVTNCEVLFFFTYTYTKAISSIHSILRSKINEAERFKRLLIL